MQIFVRTKKNITYEIYYHTLVSIVVVKKIRKKFCCFPEKTVASVENYTLSRLNNELVSQGFQKLSF